MAEQSVTIQGQHKQANTAGTNDRKELRESISAFVKVFLIGLIVVAAIVGGYALVDGARDMRARQARVEPTAPATTQPASAMIPARASGEVIAPMGSYSVWLKLPRNHCLHWWAENPSHDAAMVKSRFMDWNGDVWSGPSANKYVQARSWQSEVDRPVRIVYQTAPRRSDGSCPDF